MERYSRSWVVAAAAGADFTYQILPDDVHGVDMTVRDDFHSVDFQLKSTCRPKVENDHFSFDLDVRTYDILRDPDRSGYGVLALVVIDGDRTRWLDMDHDGTQLARAAYYLPLHGLPPTANTATIRLGVPKSNLLTIDAMKWLMASAGSRWTR